MLIYHRQNIRVWRGFLQALLAGVAYTDVVIKMIVINIQKGVSMGPGFETGGNSAMLPAFEVSIGDFRSDG